MILAFLQPLQNVLYVGILTTPSRIYIVIDYTKISSLKIDIFDLKIMAKSGLEFELAEFKK